MGVPSSVRQIFGTIGPRWSESGKRRGECVETTPAMCDGLSESDLVGASPTVVERDWFVVGHADRRWPFEVETARPRVVSERAVVFSGPSLRAVLTILRTCRVPYKEFRALLHPFFPARGTYLG